MTSVGGQVTMSTLAIRPLNAELQVIAKEELFEEPEKIQEYLEAFREWIRKSPHLKSRTDDQFLVTFLRGCKYSLERAKQKLDMFYTLRTHIPEIFHERDPTSERMREMIKLGVGLPLPITETPGSPRMFLFRIGAYDPHKFSILEIMKVSVMITDLMMKEDDNLIVAGQIEVMDLANCTFAHLIQFQPALMKKMTMMTQDATPIRVKGMHLINAPAAFEQIFNLFKSFVNEKMNSRLFVHSTFESLYKVVPRRMMPTEYEGEAGSLASLTETWEKKILAHREYFLDDAEKYGVDEKKRVGRPKNPESLFGIDGTFRQLQFD